MNYDEAMQRKVSHGMNDNCTEMRIYGIQAEPAIVI